MTATPARLPAMELEGYMGRIDFDGGMVTVHKKLRGSTTVLVRQISTVSIENAGIGMRAIRIGVGGSGGGRPAVAFGSHSDAAQDPYSLTFRKKHLPEFEKLRMAILMAAAA